MLIVSPCNIQCIAVKTMLLPNLFKRETSTNQAPTTTTISGNDRIAIVVVSSFVAFTLIIGCTLFAWQQHRRKEKKRMLVYNEKSSHSPIQPSCGFQFAFWRSRTPRPISDIRNELLAASRREKRRMSVLWRKRSHVQHHMDTPFCKNVSESSRSQSPSLEKNATCYTTNQSAIEKPARVLHLSKSSLVFDSTAVQDMPWLVFMPLGFVPESKVSDPEGCARPKYGVED